MAELIFRGQVFQSRSRAYAAQVTGVFRNDHRLPILVIRQPDTLPPLAGR